MHACVFVFVCGEGGVSTLLCRHIFALLSMLALLTMSIHATTYTIPLAFLQGALLQAGTGRALVSFGTNLEEVSVTNLFPISDTESEVRPAAICYARPISAWLTVFCVLITFVVRLRHLLSYWWRMYNFIDASSDVH